MPPPPVEARALSKAYGLLPVLRGIALTVEGGELVAILGRNGAGKSTLLKLLACIARPSSGELRLFGEVCFPGRPDPRTLGRIGFLGHEPLVYQDLTVLENLTHYERIYRLDRRQPSATNGSPGRHAPGEHAARALDRVGLRHAADRVTRQLSRGMLQRLAIARAILHAPDLLLLDEPFTSLDEASSEVLTGVLRELAARGVAVIFVTHDLPRLASIATRVLVLHAGRLSVDLCPAPPLDELAPLYRRVTGGEEPHVGDHS